MKTRLAIIIPLAVFIIALGAVFVADRNNRSYNYDISAIVDEITVLDNGDLLISAHSIWNGVEVDETTADITGMRDYNDMFYELTVPEKLAKKYDLYEGMLLTCDVEETGGKTVVTKLPKSYKK